MYTSSSEIGIAALNQPDKRYLGYKAKNDYTISNITTDKTLYAVYYKSLQGTTLASKDNPTAQEFIWNDAIWRVINTKSTGVTASNRLVIKVNALTQRDLDQSEKESTAYVSFSKNSFYFASSNTIQGNGYETGASETGVDNRKYLKGAIDYYYEHKIQDETNVEKVNLNNPTFEQYRSIGFTGSVTGTPAYSNWSWDNWSRDTRFSTSLDGDKKQAFALSFGDINKFTTLESDGIKALLLNFSGTNTYQYWLRSPGRSAMYAGAINSGSMGYDFSVRQSITEKIRPALWLSIN